MIKIRIKNVQNSSSTNIIAMHRNIIAINYFIHFFVQQLNN